MSWVAKKAPKEQKRNKEYTMDLAEIKALGESTTQTIRPFKLIIYWLLIAIVISNAAIGYCFYTFMSKAFESGTGATSVTQTADNMSTVSNEINN